MKPTHNTASAEFPDSSIKLAALIDAKVKAHDAFCAAIDHEQKMEAEYFAAHPETETVILLQIGGGVTFGVRFDLDDYRDTCLDQINDAYDRRGAGVAKVLATLVSEEAARAKVDECRAGDIRALGEAYAAAQASRDRFGYGQAVRDRSAASDTDSEALTAVCAFRCKTWEELAVKSAFLLDEATNALDMEPHNLDALFRSMMPEDQEGGDA